MELTGLTEKVTGFIKQNKFVLLVVALGVFLMLLPERKKDIETVIPAQQENILSVEEQLSKILSYVEGAGEVQVLLTQAIGEEILYQTDTDTDTSPETEHCRVNTVTVTDSDRTETGLIRQINPPKYLGAIVVCHGADDPSVRLAIVAAVSKVTGLGADKISVLKMR